MTIAILIKIWKDHDISKEIKLYLMKTLIFTMTYGFESWILNSLCQQRIDAFEKTVYRRMLWIPQTECIYNTIT